MIESAVQKSQSFQFIVVAVHPHSGICWRVELVVKVEELGIPSTYMDVRKTSDRHESSTPHTSSNFILPVDQKPFRESKHCGDVLFLTKQINKYSITIIRIRIRT